jgi:hypothetical protein
VGFADNSRIAITVSYGCSESFLEVVRIPLPRHRPLPNHNRKSFSPALTVSQSRKYNLATSTHSHAHSHLHSHSPILTRSHVDDGAQTLILDTRDRQLVLLHGHARTTTGPGDLRGRAPQEEQSAEHPAQGAGFDRQEEQAST